MPTEVQCNDVKIQKIVKTCFAVMDGQYVNNLLDLPEACLDERPMRPLDQSLGYATDKPNQQKPRKHPNM